jgi:hypothetical protein
MDSSFNNFENDYEEHDIRPPDNVITEQLLEDTRDEFEKEIDEAIYLSIKDCQIQEKTNKEYEENVINEYLRETKNRKEKFSKLLVDMNRIGRVDKSIKEIYEIVEPIIDAYCNQYIEYYELDNITYEKIFKTILTIRINKEMIDLLKTIIINCAYLS